MNFTFAGCGFMGIYHIGVASCLKVNAPHLLKGQVGGASAGAIVACVLLCDCPLGLCTRWTLRLATKARSRSLGPMHPTFDISQLLSDGLHEILPENAHDIVSGRLHVSMTRVSDGTNVMVNEFSTREELIQALLCSAFIPFYSGLIPPTFRGERCVDGALSNNLPIIDQQTVTVSPFAGRNDICPDDDCANVLHMFLSNTSIQFSVTNLYRMSRIMFPPHPEKLSTICQRGFDDALKYLQRNNLTNCVRHISSQPRMSRSRTVYGDLNELDGSGCEAFSCPDCASSKEKVAVGGLPRTVVTALNEAVELVNSSYLLYIRNTKFYRTFSIACSPLYLPLDLTLLSVVKILRYLPRLSQDLHWLVSTLLFYAHVLSGKIAAEGRRTYTARLICRFAIQEVQHDHLAEEAQSSCIGVQAAPAVRSLDIGFGAGVIGSTVADPSTDQAMGNATASDDGYRNVGAAHVTDRGGEAVTFGLTTPPCRSRAGSLVRPRLLSGAAILRASASCDCRAAGGVETGAVLSYYCAAEDGLLRLTEVYNVSNLFTPSQLDALSAGRGNNSSGTTTPTCQQGQPRSDLMVAALGDSLVENVSRSRRGSSPFVAVQLPPSPSMTDGNEWVVLSTTKAGGNIEQRAGVVASCELCDASATEVSWDSYLEAVQEHLSSQ